METLELEFYEIIIGCLVIGFVFMTVAFFWAIDKWHKALNKLHQKPNPITELCVGCGRYKYPKFRGVQNECICSEDCKEVYENY